MMGSLIGQRAYFLGFLTKVGALTANRLIANKFAFIGLTKY